MQNKSAKNETTIFLLLLRIISSYILIIAIFCAGEWAVHCSSVEIRIKFDVCYWIHYQIELCHISALYYSINSQWTTYSIQNDETITHKNYLNASRFKLF